MGGMGDGSRFKRLRIERLEERCVLAATPLITEFMASNSTTLLDGNGDSSDWVEIYNPTAAAINLAGWHLTDSAGNLQKWTFPSIMLGSGEYLVVFASSQPVDNYVDPGGNHHTNFALSASGEYLALVDPTGIVAMEYAPGFPPQSVDVSYGLDPLEQGAYFTNPTPGGPNDNASAVTRGVVVSEVMYHPASELVGEEYVEIYNGEATSVDLTGWTLTGAVEFQFPAVSLNAGQYLVIAADTPAFAAKYPIVTNVVGGWQGKLSNQSDTIQLRDASGQQVDDVTYFDEGEWALREVGPLDLGHRGWVWSDAHDGGGSSLELTSFGLSNNWGQQWQASSVEGGTPGAINSTADVDGDVAPLILNVSQFPVIPSSTETVVVSAHLVDELTAGLAATLYWRVDGAVTFTPLAMTDDGTGADAVSGDRTFAAEIPALPDGTVVEFYVESADQADNRRTYPTPSAPSGAQLTNLIYQVDDSFNPAALPGPGDAPIYRLIMTEAERAELEQIGSSGSQSRTHARMNGTFIAVTDSGVDVRYRVGIRNRGFGSANDLPNSYHVDMPRDASLNGLEAINFNTQYTHLQLLGLQLFQSAGLIAEDTQAVDVRVNGVDLSLPGSPSFGVYVQLEAADDVFATNHFPDDDGGNLYRVNPDEDDHRWGDLRDLGTDASAYVPFYDKKTNASEVDYSDVIELVDVLNNASDSEYFDKVQQIVDVDQWLGYFATVAILTSEETMLGTGSGDDYLLYRGENDPRFVLIPHDMDTILGQGDTPGSPTSGIYRAAELPTVARFLMHPQILPAYHEKLQYLLQTTFSKSAFDSLVDDVVGGFAPAQRVSDIKTFMDSRRTFIQDLIEQPLTANAQLPTVGGFFRTTQDDVALSGAAPLADTRSVTAGGVVADYDPVTGQWSLGESTGGDIVSLVSSGDTWFYLDAGQTPSTAPGSDWRVDDPGWTTFGPSQLGYGDGDEATVVQFVDTDPAQSGTQKNITTYFRKTFDVSQAENFSALTLQLVRDDGAVVYLNGNEVERPNMPAGTIDSTTEAFSTTSGSEEDQFFEFALDPSMLIEGENVIAVEIHQISPTSSDISFDLELQGILGSPESVGGLPLRSGVNRIEVQAYDEVGGAGNVVDSTLIDVWYDDGNQQIVSGNITTNTLWTAASGPYVVTGDIAVVGPASLTIEPGTSVFFNSGTGLTIRDEGRIVAEGTANKRIRFAHNPATGVGSWDGLVFTDTAEDNRLTYIDMQSGDDAGQAVLIDTARVLFDHASWFDVDDQILDLVHPSLVVSNSNIPGISGDETIHLLGLDQGEQLIVENSVIGFNTSGDDVVDLGHDTLTPPTIVFRGNEFLGGFDDGIDTDGFPVLIEHNIFHDFHKGTPRATTSNAVSTGHVTVSGQTVSSNLTLRYNTFINNDHHLLLKDFSFATLENNTFVDATFGAVHFAEPIGTSVIGPGLGADIDGNMFWGTGETFLDATAETLITLNRSIVPADLVNLGTGNLAADPLLVDPAAGDFSVERGSPALRAGPNGTDIGAVQTPRFTPASAANLRVTELHYHPLAGDKSAGEIGGGDGLFEFIELQNVGNETIDLTDVAFDDGIDFTFPWLASLDAGEVAVLVRNLDLFRSRYGSQVPVAGVFSGSLSNSGESVRIVAAGGATIAAFTFDDSPPWPTAADGNGPSLEIVDPLLDPNSPANWRASNSAGGNPGTVGRIPGDYDGNQIVQQADYEQWKATYGTAVTPNTGADGNGDGIVNAADYIVWRNHVPPAPAATSNVALDDNGDNVASLSVTYVSPNAPTIPSAGTSNISAVVYAAPSTAWSHDAFATNQADPVTGDDSLPGPGIESSDSTPFRLAASDNAFDGFGKRRRELLNRHPGIEDVPFKYDDSTLLLCIANSIFDVIANDLFDSDLYVEAGHRPPSHIGR